MNDLLPKRYFEFKQPPSEMSCGWRCLAYILRMGYCALIQKYSCMKPVENGMYLTDVTRILNDYEVEWHYSFPTKRGLYLVFTKTETHESHFVVYDNGYLYDSMCSSPKKKGIRALQRSLERGKHDEDNCPVYIRINE